MVVVDVYCWHVSALAELLLDGGKRRAHERAWNAATFGGRSAFLRLLCQPQNECIAAGGQCAIPIWGCTGLTPFCPAPTRSAVYAHRLLVDRITPGQGRWGGE